MTLPRGKPLPNRMDIGELAPLAKLTVRTLQRWCRDKLLPARKMGKSWVVNLRLLKERNEDLYEELDERWHEHQATRVRG